MHKILKARATFAANKAQICLSEVLIVGQQCNAQGCEPDTSKIDKVIKWPRLITPKKVCQFLGLCGTVQIWIPNYSKLVCPLTKLYHKDKEFIWGEYKEQAFQMIKQLITSAPALRPIDYKSERLIFLFVDSSQEAAGMILSQLNEQE